VADSAGQVGDGGVEIDTWQLTIMVVENLGVGDAEYPTGILELAAANVGKIGFGCGIAAMRGALARSEANHAGFDTARLIVQQSAAEVGGFVVGMGGDHQQPEHAM